MKEAARVASVRRGPGRPTPHPAPRKLGHVGHVLRAAALLAAYSSSKQVTRGQRAGDGVAAPAQSPLPEPGCAAPGPTGRLQSPIDVAGYSTRDDCADLAFHGYHHKAAGLTITNSGNTAKVESKSLSFMAGGPLSNVYRFSQMHFHWGDSDAGSEHAIDNKTFPLELHLVHYNTKYSTVSTAMRHSDGIAVAALLFQLTDGQTNNDSGNPLTLSLRQIVKPKSIAELPSNSLDFLKTALESPTAYYYYNGSLTTKPYCENVHWIILESALPISTENLDHFRSLESTNGPLILNNRRPHQEKFNRDITFCRRKESSSEPTSAAGTAPAVSSAPPADGTPGAGSEPGSDTAAVLPTVERRVAANQFPVPGIETIPQLQEGEENFVSILETIVKELDLK